MKYAVINDNNNSSHEEEGKEVVGIELTEQNADPENDENAIEFRWSDIWGEDEEDIVKANLIESLQRQDAEQFFQKKEAEFCLIITATYIKKI